MQKSTLVFCSFSVLVLSVCLSIVYIMNSNTQSAVAAPPTPTTPNPATTLSSDFLPPGSNTVAGPGFTFGTLDPDNTNPFAKLYDGTNTSGNVAARDLCMTLTNVGTGFICAQSDSGHLTTLGDIDPGDTRTYCDNTNEFWIECGGCGAGGPPGTPDCAGHWRIDMLNPVN